LENNMKTLRDYIDLVDKKFNQALSEKVTLPADGSTPQTQTVNGVTMNAPANAVQTGSGGVLTTGNGAAVTSGTPAPAPDAAAAAKAKLTPSQLKWLGGADATDQHIMARMPKPLPGEAVPGAAPAQAAQPAASALPAGMTQAQVDQARNAEEPDAAPAAAQAATIASGQPDDATGVDAAVAAQAAAPAQAAQPAAKPKVMAKSDPAVMKLQQDLIAKGAKIKADGVMGPATQAAQKQFAGAGAGRGGQGGPTAAQLATAPAQAAQPAAPAPYNAAKDSQAANVAKESRTARNDHAFIDELNAMRSIAGIPTKNKW